MVAWTWNIPRRLECYKLGPQVVTLFWKVVEPLQSQTSLEGGPGCSISHSHFLSVLCFLFGHDVRWDTQLHPPATMKSLVARPPWHNTLYSLQYQDKVRPSALTSIIGHHAGKVTNAPSSPKMLLNERTALAVTKWLEQKPSLSKEDIPQKWWSGKWLLFHSMAKTSGAVSRHVRSQSRMPTRSSDGHGGLRGQHSRQKLLSEGILVAGISTQSFKESVH